MDREEAAALAKAIRAKFAPPEESVVEEEFDELGEDEIDGLEIDLEPQPTKPLVATIMERMRSFKPQK